MKSTLAKFAICAALGIVISGCTNPKSEQEAQPEANPVEQPDAEVAIEVSEPLDSAPVPDSEPPTRGPDLIAQHLETLEPVARLGGRLFYDSRLSNPGANLAASCRTCHVPPFLSNGNLLYSDSVALSVMPANSTGGKLTTQRNALSLQDATLARHFNWDGEYTDLDDFLWSKLTSTHMGWEDGQEEQVQNELHALMFNDQGEDAFSNGTYAEQLLETLDIDVNTAEQPQVLDAIIHALRAYLDTIQSTDTSAYDAFAYLNRLNEGLTDPTDTPVALSGRVFGRIANQEGRVLVRFPNVFNEAAYQGYKTFMRVEETVSMATGEMETNVGSCVTCHVPPKFTDGLFHNTGVTQSSYDAEHGEGAFLELDPADADDVDLGRYEFEPNPENLAAFRTPGLRNITKTAPYHHDGQLVTLEDVIRHKIAISNLAKAGKLRNPHPAFLAMNLSDDDVRNLAAFLTMLDEVPEDEYRDFRIENVRIRRGPNVALSEE